MRKCASHSASKTSVYVFWGFGVQLHPPGVSNGLTRPVRASRQFPLIIQRGCCNPDSVCSCVVGQAGRVRPVGRVAYTSGMITSYASYKSYTSYRKTTDNFLLFVGPMGRYTTNACIARNPVDSFFVVRCFFTYFGHVLYPEGIAYQSPGLRYSATLGGWTTISIPNPERVV